jgi:hypothetical protein
LPALFRGIFLGTLSHDTLLHGGCVLGLPAIVLGLPAFVSCSRFRTQSILESGLCIGTDE